jgi:hypothetical protein
MARLEVSGAFNPEPSSEFRLEPTDSKSREAVRYAKALARAKTPGSSLRLVRSPRFSRDEFERVKRQASRLNSLAGHPQMPPLEFIREASMAVAQVLEHLENPSRIWELIRGLRGQRHAVRPPARARNAPPSSPGTGQALTLEAEGFERGTEGICYVCGLPAAYTRKEGLTFDYIGRAHNKCLVGLGSSLVKKRDRLLDGLRKQGVGVAMPSREEILSGRGGGPPMDERPDCAKCNDQGHYEENGESYTCVCKHGLGDEPENPTCALCDDQGKSDGIQECPCKRGALMTQLERKASKAGAA